MALLLPNYGPRPSAYPYGGYNPGYGQNFRQPFLGQYGRPESGRGYRDYGNYRHEEREHEHREHEGREWEDR